MSYVRIFDKNATDFTSRGLGVLNNVITCYVEEYLNGAYECFLEYPLYDSKSDLIQEDRIIVCSTPVGFQAFRIYKKALNDAETVKQVYARHIFYDLNDNFIENINMRGYTCTNAVKHIIESTVEKNNFNVTGNVTDKNNLEIVRKNPTEAILSDDDNSIINRYSFEIKRNNWNIGVLNKYERDNKVRFKYARDYYGLKVETDFSNVVTKIMPEGFDGLFLPEKYVISDNIGKYKNVKIKVEEFSDIKAKTKDYTEADALPLDKAYAKLREEAKKKFTKDKIDLPETTLTLNYTNLSKTEEFKEYAYLFKLLPFDRVIIEHNLLNLNIEVKMNYYNWNSIYDEYNSLQFGSSQKSIVGTINKSIVNNYNANTTETLSYISTAVTQANNYTDATVNTAIEDINSSFKMTYTWNDGNSNNEDRTGYLISLVNDNVEKANDDKNIIGTVTTSNGSKCEATLYGICECLQDGTCSAGDYITASNGIATKSETSTRFIVVSVTDDTHIKIIMR